jgi:hypothetical protein
MSTESVGSCASSLLPRRLFQEEPDQSFPIVPGQMSTPFSPPLQEGHFRNSVSDCSCPSGAVSTPSDRPVLPMAIPENAPEAVSSPSFSPWQDGDFNTDNWHGTSQPTKVRNPQITPEAIKAPYSPEGYNVNKCLESGAGGSGPLDRKAMVTIMMDGYDVPEAEMQCPCGGGPYIVLISRTDKNPNRPFYKCLVNK